MTKKLYVGNLTYSVNEPELESLFSRFGTVQSARIIVDRDTIRSKGFGFVEMDTEAEARAAIQALHDQEHNGRRLTVKEAPDLVKLVAAAVVMAATVAAAVMVVAAVTAAVTEAVLDRVSGGPSVL